jgi:hypothetical protein
LPQAPQFSGSSLGSAQYAAGPAPQVTLGGLHVAAQLPPEQRWPAAHALPQTPQFSWSLETSAHAWPCGGGAGHSTSVAMQLTVQIPVPLHTCPAGQTLPQAPQLLESRPRFAQ